MKKKVILILSCLFLSVGLIYSQTVTVKGVVVDEQGQGLVGASVVIKGTTTGVSAGSGGSFTLNVPENTTLVFALVGMQTKEVKAASNMKVVLEYAVFETDEVMVVAYGTVKKGAFTGSAAVIDSDIISKTVATSFEKALQGASPGIQVASLTGQPGAATSVRIRGIGSISGDSSPLYVIDGVPIHSSGNSSGRLGSTSEFSQVADTYNPLSSLNSEDIENIVVLKDASAASLYGSRAANGVVLITTKKGKQGKSSVNFKAQFGFSKLPGNGYNLMNGAQIFKHYYDGSITDLTKRSLNPKDSYYGKTPAELNELANKQVISTFGHNPYDKALPFDLEGNIVNGARMMYDTDWMSEVFRTGKSQQYDLSVSGGNEKTQYYVGVGYLKTEGVAIQSGLDRYSGRINITSEANKWIKVGANTTFSLSNQNTPSTDGGGSSAIVHALAMPGVIPMFDLDDNFEKQYDPITGEVLYNYKNPIYNNMNGVDLAYKDIYKTRTYRALVNPWIEVKPIDKLSWKTSFAYDYTHMDETQWYNKKYGNAASINGRLYKYSILNNTMTLSSQLSYGFTIAEKHNFDAMAGVEFTNNVYKRLYAMGTGFSPAFDIIELAGAANKEGIGSLTNKDNLNSYFGRLNYDFAEKYYLSLSLRTDGSSRFGKDNKYGTFWSVGANWRLSSEKFMEATKGWLYDAKIRASYGTTGEKNTIGKYDSLGLFASTTYNADPAVYRYQLANSSLAWEKANLFNVGLDYNLFGRLYGTIEFYNKVSDKLLLDRPLAPSTGMASITMNAGKLRNRGIEFSLTSVNIKNKNILWETTLNLSHNSNKLMDYPEKQTISGTKIWTDGYSVYEFFLAEWAGVDKETGAPLWYMDKIEEAEDGTEIITRVTTSSYSSATKYKQGSALPAVQGSLSNRLEYKGIDLSFMFSYSFGGKVYDGYEADLLNDGNRTGYQMITEAMDSWTVDNKNAKNPLFKINNASNSNSTSTRFLHKASFIKFRNISLGYTLPKNISRNLYLDSIRLFATVDNVYTWSLDSNFKGYDPELGGVSGLMDGRGTIPLPRTFLFGFSLGL